MKSPAKIIIAALVIVHLPVRLYAASATNPTGLFGAGSAGRSSSSAPAVDAGDVPLLPLPAPMPSDLRTTFQQDRSIFAKGLPTIGGRPIDVPPIPPSPVSGGGSAQRTPEQYLMFNGVAVENGIAVAFIEDTDTLVVTQVKSGDFIGRGTVGQITLSGLDYMSGDRVTHVVLGQSLTGQNSWRSTTDPTAVQHQGHPPDDGELLQRMIQRRVDEQRTMQ
jgi:hypothetical protein